MTINEMLGQSGLLTLLGMCVVFLFIIILIGCMKLLQIFVRVCKLDKEQKVENTVISSSSVKNNDGEIIAAISMAIKEKELI